jgi:hypothetical protein
VRRRLALAAATAKGSEFGREYNFRDRTALNARKADTEQLEKIKKNQATKTMKKVATGKVKRAIKRTVAASSPGKIDKRDLSILADAWLGVRETKKGQ